MHNNKLREREGFSTRPKEGEGLCSLEERGDLATLPQMKPSFSLSLIEQQAEDLQPDVAMTPPKGRDRRAGQDCGGVGTSV